MEKKSIVFVIHNMNIGGTEKSLLSLLYTLDRSKYKITILMLENYGGYLSEVPDWVDLEYLDNFHEMKKIITLPPLQSIRKFLKEFKIKSGIGLCRSYLKAKISNNWDPIYEFAAKQIHISTYDIAVAYAGPSDFITYLVSEKIEAEYKIQWIHFDVPKVISNGFFGNKYYPKFDKIYCVSGGSKVSFLKAFPYLSEKTEIFENIITDEEILKKSDIGETFNDGFDGIRILTVGRLTKEKGHKFIPEIVKNLLEKTDKEFRWYIIGEGIEKDSIKDLVGRMGLSNYVKFLGLKSNPYKFMKDCDIYVQPSLHEGYGITVAEAKVFNKPILITNFASSENLIKSGKTGIIANTDVESLTTQLFSLFDRSSRNKFSENLALENSKRTKTDYSDIF
ncbi:Glycosyltransferase involved in cell wall bisynthesis [Salegentibacter agarivorans]|uniref:Glycosyltransferase involved in cell wall bisynthesis n=1 Tax=Salegentibacter agarivorans TaxID=345907 RepID=A0A1I2K4Q2_9FLAO|nr:glycosyltransferase [Salegentibacter agarivorans]SFF60187.1 Glycosyltransferase involved in cell wall bisynthesis [Salegentibacter agarivorans]